MKRNSPLYYSRDKGNSEYVYSFIQENSLNVVSENGQTTVYPCKSKYAPEKISPIIASGDLLTDVIAKVKTPEYTSLLYDKWKKLYYRFYYPGIEPPKDMGMEYFWALKDTPQLFSVMILNEDLQVIGETLMPKNKYTPYMSFLNEDGLHFALHVNNPDFDPDYLKFAKFTVEKIMK